MSRAGLSWCFQNDMHVCGGWGGGGGGGGGGGDGQCD